MRYRTRTFHIRFTEKEYERLCLYAEKAGLPKTTYIRHMINGCQPKEKPPADFWAFRRELCAIGNNLNQLVRAAHRFDSIHIAKMEELNNRHSKLYHAVIDRMEHIAKLDIPATLEQGRLFEEQEQKRGVQNDNKQ